MAEAFKVSFDDTSLQAELDQIVAASQEAVRPAAQAGAEELYFEARLRCPVSEHAHVFYGKNSKASGVTYRFSPGNLRDSLYQAFSKDNSAARGKGYDRATYHVAWNHQKAPYGFMVEFGTPRAPAHPFLRPAYDARRTEALETARAVWVLRVGEVTK